MRILCCCEGGNCRSVTLATLLKYYFRPADGHDAMALSLGKNSPETQRMMFEWAEVILVVQDAMVTDVPEEYRHKVSVIPVGRDRWGLSMHPLFVPLAIQLLTEAGFEPKEGAVEKALATQGKFVRRRREEC